MNCIWKRSRIASAIDSGEPLPADLKGHLEDCPSCRRFHAAQQGVATLLEQTVDQDVTYPDEINARIMRTISEPSRERADSPHRTRRASPWLAPLAFASIALVAALFLIVRQPEPDRPTLAGNEKPVIEDTIAPEVVPRDYIRSWSVAINQPLDNELESVVADARSAVRFLAVNFLPESDVTENL